MTTIEFGDHSNQNFITEDVIVPFLIEDANLRGRAIRLNDAVNKIIARHNYPTPVAKLLAELLTLTALLGATLKSNRIITIQIQCKGAITLLVTDFTDDGNLRGYAQFDKTEINKIKGNNISLKRLITEGYMVISMHNKASKRPHQGIIELKGKSLSECFAHYFSNSEQINVMIETAIKKRKSSWAAGSIMVQHIPSSKKKKVEPETAEENWNRTKTLLRTTTQQELTDKKLPLHDLLYNLFHEDGVRVYEPKRIHAHCRCSREKVETTLKTMDQKTIDPLYNKKGTINVTCEFCKTEQIFTKEDLQTP